MSITTIPENKLLELNPESLRKAMEGRETARGWVVYY